MLPSRRTTTPVQNWETSAPSVRRKGQQFKARKQGSKPNPLSLLTTHAAFSNSQVPHCEHLFDVPSLAVFAAEDVGEDEDAEEVEPEEDHLGAFEVGYGVEYGVRRMIGE